MANIKQLGIPLIKSYSRKQSGAGQQNWMIDHDKRGLIYFANNDGLLVFDGTSWDIFPLPHHTVLRSIKVIGGRIYAGGYNELGYFHYNRQGELKYVSLMDSVPEAYRNPENIWRIHKLGNRVVFQSYKYILIFNKLLHCRAIKAPSYFHFSFMSNGELYVEDMQKGLLRLTPERLVTVPGMDRLKGVEIWAMLPLGSNTLVATVESGIYLYDGLKLTPWNNEASRFLMKNQLYSALVLDGKNLAFGSIQNGLLICDWNGKIKLHINRDNGLQNNTILSMHKGPSGNLWLGSDNGIDMVEINSPLSFMGPTSGLSAGYAAVRYHDTLYVGTNQGVFYKPWFNKLQNGDKQFRLVENTRGQAWSLQVIDNQLFCGHNKGFFRIDGTRAQNICHIPGGWTLFKLPGHPNYMLGGTYTGIVLFAKKNGQWKFVGKVQNFDESSRVIVVESDSSIWIAHGFKGIFHLVFSHSLDKVKRAEFYNRYNGFPSSTRLGVCRLQGKILFTSPKGFYRFQAETSRFVKEKKLNKILGSDVAEVVFEDSKGSIWFFTARHAGVLRRQEDGSLKKITAPFANISGQFINGFEFVYPMDNHNVFIGMDKGLIHYDPSFEKKYDYSFNAFIGQISLMNSGYQMRHLHLSDALDSAIQFPFKNNHLYFEFSANDFENSKKLVFSSNLEGFDQRWSPWTSKHSSEFTNLSEGNYTFRVKARNAYGVVSREAAFHFIILPPWYRTTTAYVGYVVLVFLMILLLMYFFYKRLEYLRRREKLEQERQFNQKERKILLEKLQAEKEVIRLKNEQLHKEMIAQDMELSNATFGIIQKNQLLMRLKGEISKMMKRNADEVVNAQYNTLLKKINREIDNKHQWKVFEAHFEAVHEEFLKRLKGDYPSLSPRELKLCAYLRLNISTKEIALLMNISARGVEVSRYRLRNKLRLDRKENLVEFILKL